MFMSSFTGVVLHLFMYSSTVLLSYRRKSTCNVFRTRNIHVFITSFTGVRRTRNINVFMYISFTGVFRTRNIHSAFVINRLPGMLLLMRCEFPIDNNYVSGRVHSTNRTNRSNRQR